MLIKPGGRDLRPVKLPWNGRCDQCGSTEMAKSGPFYDCPKCGRTIHADEVSA